MYISAALFLFVIIPITMFWHEVEDDETVTNKWRPVLMQWGITIVVAALIIVITFFIFNTAHLPITEYECDLGQTCTNKVGVENTITVGVRFDIYLMAFLC